MPGEGFGAGEVQLPSTAYSGLTHPKPLSLDAGPPNTDRRELLDGKKRSRRYSISAVILPLTSFNVIVSTLESLTSSKVTECPSSSTRLRSQVSDFASPPAPTFFLRRPAPFR